MNFDNVCNHGGLPLIPFDPPSGQRHIWRYDHLRTPGRDDSVGQACYQFQCRLCGQLHLISQLEARSLRAIPKDADPRRDLDRFEHVLPGGLCAGKRIGVSR